MVDDATVRLGQPGADSAPPVNQRIAVVVNGNARGVTHEVIGTLDQILAGGDLFVSRRLKDVRDIARTLVARGYGTVLTGGGDGTFTVMVSAIVQQARKSRRPLPRFGLLRLGTGNALAWVVGAGQARRRGFAADIERLKEDAGSRSLRLVEVEDYIAPFCGLGVDATVLQDYQQAKHLLSKTPLRRVAPGAMSYAMVAVTRSMPRYLIKKAPHCRIINRGTDAYRVGAKGAQIGHPIPLGEVIYEGPAQVAALGTIPYYGFGFRAFPFAQERLDRMQLRVSTISVARFVRNFGAIWRGEFDDPGQVFDYLVDSISIEMDPETPFQIGGDPQGLRRAVDARLAPEPIRLVDFYAPPSAA